MLNLYFVLAFVTIILLDPQALTVSVAKSAGSTTAHTSFHSDAISRNYQARARPLITLSSGEYDNTEGGETSSRDSDHYGDEEESTSTGRSFSLEDCARLLTSTAPPDSGVTSSRTIGGGGFAIRIAGMPTKYLHGESYTVLLQAPPEYSNSPPRRFIGFTLLLSAGSDDHHSARHRGRSVTDIKRRISHRAASMEHPRRAQDIVGAFQTFGDALSRLLSDDCGHVVNAASSVPKSEVSVIWTAPPIGASCVIFSATVIESPETWFADDNELTKELCPEEREDEDVQPPLLAECCACDEAKYELIFEGLWSKNTHPIGYPENAWLTYFSDIIGASHAADFRMWQYGGPPSDGVRSVAEQRSTSRLEAELKAQSGKIRTIIKARGLWHPAATDGGRTFAVFRVDRRHHVVSALSALGPPSAHTPSWLVGVSALELCLRNCSWVASKTMNLYPWHAVATTPGVSGDTEESTHPIIMLHRSAPIVPQLIRPVETAEASPMKPVARLTITRQRLYEKVLFNASCRAARIVIRRQGQRNCRIDKHQLAV
ncbi:spondin-1-like [Varroa jacobsoni]|uniref:spondin-1-like n=1 Tax=Varroa jacobsoni TaxID=62625 RepID=UPI000BF27E5D|nr:spondin-1-like [Varroa jacobsoni]